jgi:hypothetical protein
MNHKAIAEQLLKEEIEKLQGIALEYANGTKDVDAVLDGFARLKGLVSS